MAIPDFQTIMLPLLKFLGDGKKQSVSDQDEFIVMHFNITDAEKRETLSSGTQPLYKNRIGWARTHIKLAGLIESPERGVSNITKRGLKVLEDPPDKITVKFLMKFPEFVEKKYGKKKDDKDPDKGVDELLNKKTPDELIDLGYQSIKKNLTDQLLAKIKDCKWDFFENLVVDVLLKIGYGGSKIEYGEVVGRSGDEGIDGIIKEDRLGLDIIYIQAKKWDATIGRPEIQKFVGALQGKKARKGVFITTSKFSNDAIEYSKSIDSRVVLIDGEELANLMIDYDVGVSLQRIYKIKKIDTDYFIEE